MKLDAVQVLGRLTLSILAYDQRAAKVTSAK